jgi:hypothetical protein
MSEPARPLFKAEGPARFTALVIYLSVERG